MTSYEEKFIQSVCLQKLCEEPKLPLLKTFWKTLNVNKTWIQVSISMVAVGKQLFEDILIDTVLTMYPLPIIFVSMLHDFSFLVLH